MREKLKTKDEDEKPSLSAIAHTKVGYKLQDNSLSNQNKDKSNGLATADPMLKMLPDCVDEYKSKIKNSSLAYSKHSDQ